MNRMFTFGKVIGTLLLLSVASLSKASLIGDEICFSAMQGPTTAPCELIVVQDPAPLPPAPIDIEIVQLQLVSAQPVQIDSFFDIFVDIDLRGESITFDFSQQPTPCIQDPQIPCPIDPPPPIPWELWFEDLDWWLDPLLGIPMDGYINGLWLMWGDQPHEMLDIIDPLPEFGSIPGMGFGFLPHEIHGFIDIFTLMSFFQVSDANLLPTFELHIHTHHDIPEPSVLVLFGLAIYLIRRKLISS